MAAAVAQNFSATQQQRNMSTTDGQKARRVRDTFVNMLGEFVALNKSPDFKLSSQSSQFIANAIRDEIRRESRKRDEHFQQNYPRHNRSASTKSAFHRSKGEAAAAAIAANKSSTCLRTSCKTSTVTPAERETLSRRTSLPVINVEQQPQQQPMGLFERVRQLSARKFSSSKRVVIQNAPTSNEPVQQETAHNALMEKRHVNRRRSASAKPSTKSPKNNEDANKSNEQRSSKRTQRKATTTATCVETSLADTEQRKATRARKQKINVAEMIANIADEKEIPSKQKCYK